MTNHGGPFLHEPFRVSCRAVLLAAAGVALTPATVCADISAEEIAAFIEERPSTGSWNQPRAQIIDILNARLPNEGSAGAVATVSRELRVSPGTARALVEAALVDELPEPRSEEGRINQERRIMRAYLEAIDSAPDDPGVWNIALDHAAFMNACETPGLAERYFSSPVSKTFLDPELPCDEFVLVYVRDHEMSPMAWWKVRSLLQDLPGALQIAAARAYLGSFRNATAAGATNEPFLHAFHTYIEALADVGLSRAIVEELAGLPDELRQTVLFHAPAGSVEVGGYEVATREQATELFETARSQWLMALVDVGQRDEAQRWLPEFKLPAAGSLASKEGREYADESRVFAGEGVDLAEYLRQIVRGPTRDDPFDLFVGNGASGLLWGPANSSPIAGRVAAGFMQAAGYPDLARDQVDNLCARDDYLHEPRTWEARADELPSEIQRGLVDARRMIAESRAKESSCNENAAPLERTALRRVYREVPVPIDERIPEGQADTVPESAAVPEALLPKGIELVRSERSGDVLAGVSLSQDVDPVGEIGGGGYWFHMSADGGKTWQRPLYLGFQQYQPYVVATSSRVPLITGDKLNLEVQIQELDEGSITFPPIGLTMKREARDLYLEIPLEEIQRDSDGDTLTDWLEEKLRTDPMKADTDSDGLEDAWDDLPQVSALGKMHPDAEIVLELLENILGYDAMAVTEAVRREGADSLEDYLKSLGGQRRAKQTSRFVFIKADPAYFSGLMVPQATIVLSERDIAYLETRFGVLFPLRFPSIWVNRTNSRAVVKWSASWVGGTFEFKKIGGRWKAEVVSQWIT